MWVEDREVVSGRNSVVKRKWEVKLDGKRMTLV
jgi:hypothetical protein